MFSRITRLVGVSCLALLPALAGGCSNDPTQGYTFASQYPTNVRTVTVPIWTRGPAVYRRELEYKLTEALVKQIEHDTPYKVTKPVRADTELTGTIDLVHQRVLSTNPDDGRPREITMTFVVSFRWRDLRSGKVLVEKANYRVTGSYVPSMPFFEHDFHGAEDTINKLARRIVEELREDW